MPTHDLPHFQPTRHGHEDGAQNPEPLELRLPEPRGQCCDGGQGHNGGDGDTDLSGVCGRMEEVCGVNHKWPKE